MLIDRRKLSLHLPWIIGTLLLSLGAVVWYWIAYRAALSPRLPGGSSPVGLGLGIAAGLIFLFEFLYWPRRFKRVRAWRIGRTETWLRAHIWLGLLTLPLVLLHSGFQLGGSFTSLFMLIYLLVFGSGVLGLLLQQILPKLLLEDVPNETIYSQIENVLAQSVADAERRLAQLRGGKPLAEEAAHSVHSPSAPDRRVGSQRQVGTMRAKTRHFGDALQEVTQIEALEEGWKTEIRPFLSSLRHHSPRLQTPARANEYFQELRRRVEMPAHALVEFLKEACERRQQLARQQWLHFWLHIWLAVHLPLSISLLMLLVAHVITALKYSVSLF